MMKEERDHLDGDIHVLEIFGHSSKFAETLYLYQQQQYLCDCVVIANNGYIPAHRLVLVASSPFFQQLDSSRNYMSTFDSNFTLESDLEDVKTIMRMLYTGKLLVNGQNIHRLHKICKILQLSEAASLCEGYIQANYSTQAVSKRNSGNVVPPSLSVGYDSSKDVRISSMEHSSSIYSNTLHSSMSHLQTSHSIETNTDHDQIVLFEDGKKDKITIAKLENMPSETESRNSVSSESVINDSDYSYVLDPDDDHTDGSPSTLLSTQADDEDSRISSSSNATIEDNADNTLHMEDSHLEGGMKEEACSEAENIDDRTKFKEKQLAKMERVAYTTTKSSKKRKREPVENITETDRQPRPGIPYDLAKSNKELMERKGRKLSCRVCKLYFLQPLDLIHHRQNVHPNYNTGNRNKYMCDICYQKPNSIVRVIEHKFKKHGIPYDTEKYPTLKCDFKNCNFTTIVDQTMKSHMQKSHAKKKPMKLEYSDDTDVEEEVEKEEMDKQKEETNSQATSCSNLKVESDNVVCIPTGSMICDFSEECSRCEMNVISHQSEKVESLALSSSSKNDDETSKEKACPGISYDEEKFQEILKDRKVRKFSCRMCRLLFLNANDLWKHRLEVHPDINGKDRERYRCDICHRKPNTIVGVVEHKFKQHGIPYDTEKYPTIKCEYKKCKYTTIIKHNMKKHIEKQHDGKTPDEACSGSRKNENSDSSSESEDDLTNIPIGDVFVSIDDDGEMICKEKKDSDVTDQPPVKRRKRSKSDIEHMPNIYPGIPYKDASTHEILRDPTVIRYSCRSCKLHFLQPKDLLHHRLILHPSNKKKEKYTCDICFKKPNSVIALIEHKFKKHNIPYDMDRYPLLHCEHENCKFSTIQQQSLKDHVRKVHNCPTRKREKKAEKSETEQIKDISPGIPYEDAPMHEAFSDPTVIRYSCRTCKLYFVKPQELMHHRIVAHPSNKKKEKYTCDICFKKPNSVIGLIEHKFKQHYIPYDVDKYPSHHCTYENCKFTTIVQQTLKDHIKKVHENYQVFVCEVCGRESKSLAQHKYHSSTHTRTGYEHICSICGKSCMTIYSLKKHIEEVHQKKRKRFLCHLCPYSTYGLREFHNHLYKIHNELPPEGRNIFKCDMCDYFTLTKSYLERHKLLHQGAERTHLCPTCNKGFYSIANLKAHERRHKAEPLKCEFADCNFFTYYKHIMKNHVSGKHTNTSLRPYKCHLCNHSCKLKGNLNKHLAGKHGLEVITQVKQRQMALETGTGFQEILKTCAGARNRHLLRDLV